MQRPLIKHITAAIFLIAFLAPRMADLHAFEHLSDDNESTPCELCDITSHSVENDLALGDNSYGNEILLNAPSVHVVCPSYNSSLTTIVKPLSVYNKPPPVS